MLEATSSRFCAIQQVDQPADRGALRRGEPGRRYQHEQAGQQGGDDQRIGAAMGIIGQGHAVGQRRAAPQEGEIEAVLQREERR